ncbi:MAG: alpha/beta hydrolase [Caulobacterales bacterium]|nr:alpha/beta hydrolase [Caulobacterales bacterium]
MAAVGATGTHADDGAPAVESFTHEAGGINYYVERRGSGPDLFLVTSGQGDSGAYKLVADILAEDFTVYTFDPPGFSRSGPPPSWEGMSSHVLADQVAELVTSLGIENAHFYGSSSGGTTVMSLAIDHPELVRSAVVHEPAVVSHVPASPFFPPFKVFFAENFRTQAEIHGGHAAAARAAIDSGDDFLIMDPEAIRALGDDHIERRIANVEVWFEHYADGGIPCCNRVFTAEELTGKPITFTAGMFTMGGFTAGVEDVAVLGGSQLLWLPSKHFPYVTIPETVATVIKDAAGAGE